MTMRINLSLKNRYIGLVKDLKKEGNKCEAEMLKL